MTVRFKNISGDERKIPSLGLVVPAGETFEVPDEAAESFAQQCPPHPEALWEPTTPDARKVAKHVTEESV